MPGRGAKWEGIFRRAFDAGQLPGWDSGKPFSALPGILDSLREMAPGWREGGAALELGCGTGSTTVWFRESGRFSRSVGVDISPAALAVADEKAQSALMYLPPRPPSRGGPVSSTSRDDISFILADVFELGDRLLVTPDYYDDAFNSEPSLVEMGGRDIMLEHAHHPFFKEQKTSDWAKTAGISPDRVKQWCRGIRRAQKKALKGAQPPIVVDSPQYPAVELLKPGSFDFAFDMQCWHALRTTGGPRFATVADAADAAASTAAATAESGPSSGSGSSVDSASAGYQKAGQAVLRVVWTLLRPGGCFVLVAGAAEAHEPEIQVNPSGPPFLHRETVVRECEAAGFEVLSVDRQRLDRTQAYAAAAAAAAAAMAPVGAATTKTQVAAEAWQKTEGPNAEGQKAVEQQPGRADEGHDLGPPPCWIVSCRRPLRDRTEKPLAELELFYY